MKQSTVIFATLLLAFVIYITLRGQLAAYLSLFTGGATGQTTATTTNNSNNGAAPSSSSSVASTAQSFLNMAGKFF